jgi:hypothetical protein
MSVDRVESVGEHSPAVVGDESSAPVFDRSATPSPFGLMAENFARRIDRRQLFKRTMGLVFAGVAGTVGAGTLRVLDVEALCSSCTPPGNTWCPGADCKSIGSSCTNGCQPNTDFWSPGNCWTFITGGRYWSCCDCWCPSGPCSFYACGCEYLNGTLPQGVPDSPRMVHPANRRLNMANPDCAPQALSPQGAGR